MSAISRSIRAAAIDGTYESLGPVERGIVHWTFLTLAEVPWSGVGTADTRWRTFMLLVAEALK
jgi:hypothetical protein